MRQRLRVLDEGGCTAHATLERIRRLHARFSGLGIECVDESRLLAGDEPIRDRGELPVDLFPPLTKRGGENAALDGTPTPRHRDDDRARAERARGSHGAVEHEMRNETDEGPVLATGGLALGRVDDDHRPAVLRGDCSELVARRECSTASTAQAAELELRDQLAAAPGKRPVELEMLRRRDSPSVRAHAAEQTPHARRRLDRRASRGSAHSPAPLGMPDIDPLTTLR